jgi:MYXO-CTERM domain-containing protein
MQTTTGVTTEVPTSGGDDIGDDTTDASGSGSGSETDTDPGEDDDFANRPGCACRSDATPAAPLTLALGLLVLARRRRR